MRMGTARAGATPRKAPGELRRRLLPARDLRRQRLDSRRGDRRRESVRVPRGADQPHQQPADGLGDTEALPQRVVRLEPDQGHGSGRAARRAGLRPQHRPQPRPRARLLVLRGRRNGQDLACHAHLEVRDRGGPIGGDLLGPEAACGHQVHVRGRRGELVPRSLPPAVAGGPPAPRRPGRREAHRVGPRAALLDRQRALAGPALARGHHECRRGRAEGAGRRAHRLQAK